MKTIDERIAKHKTLMDKAERMLFKYDGLKNKWNRKFVCHQNAIYNLEVKKAKEEHTIPKEVRQEILTLVNSGTTTPEQIKKPDEKKVI